MPTSTLQNVGNAWQAGASWQTEQFVQQEIVERVNNSGGTRTAGDVICEDGSVVASYGQNATTTTTVNDKQVLGVVAPKAQGSLATNNDQYPAGAVMPVIIKGPARVNVGANAPAASDVLTTSAVAGAAITNAGAPAANAVTGSLIGVVGVAAKDANNTLLAHVQKF